jgi:uncharacterized protein
MERIIHIKSGDIKLAATLHEPDALVSQKTGKYSLVIICHGFIGSRIGVNRLFVKAARELVASGVAVLRFDYGGCGESEGEYGVGGMDVLLQQTRDVIEYAFLLERVDTSRVVLLGHSLGGAVAMLAASQDERIHALVLWAAVARPFDDITRIVGEKGYQEALSTGGTDYLGYSLQARFFQTMGDYQPLRQAHHFGGDVLLLHGNRDDVIAVDAMFHYERELRLRKKGSCETEIVLGGDHTFSSGEGYQRLISSTVNWINRQEGQQIMAV